MKEALVLDEAEWRESALCLTQPAILFFGMDENESAAQRHLREEEAKGICTHCMVRAECLEYALTTRESYGIWGGLTELERKARLRDRAS